SDLKTGRGGCCDARETASAAATSQRIASVYHRTLGNQDRDPGAYAGDERVAIGERQPGRLDRLADTDADGHRLNDAAALSHRIAAALDRHGHDRGLGFDGHDEAAL